MASCRHPVLSRGDEQVCLAIDAGLASIGGWVKQRDYSGHEPYDLLNSPLLKGRWARRQPLATLFIQLGKRVGGLTLRRWLRVPESKNPKALGLFLSAYCDLAACGHDVRREAVYLKSELKRLRSPGESDFCWGYDWDYVSLRTRGRGLPAFSPNCVATYFCANALLDMAEHFGDSEAQEMGVSAARFVVTRLQRSVDTATELCFGYTPLDATWIYNNSVLAGALLARVAASGGPAEYMQMARRTMQYLAGQQRADGAWRYGASGWHSWVDSFHTGYNLCSLLAYRRASRDHGFDPVIDSGYRYYRDHFFRADATPKYFSNRVYPIDIHSCSQAILTFCDFADSYADAAAKAVAVTRWTLANMRAPNGTFYYQRRWLVVDRTPYMRWGQAWAMHALARIKRMLQPSGECPS